MVRVSRQDSSGKILKARFSRQESCGKRVAKDEVFTRKFRYNARLYFVRVAKFNDTI